MGVFEGMGPSCRSAPIGEIEEEGTSKLDDTLGRKGVDEEQGGVVPVGMEACLLMDASLEAPGVLVVG